MQTTPWTSRSRSLAAGGGWSLFRGSLLIGALVLTAMMPAALQAQGTASTTATASSTTSETEEDATVVLSPFVVNAEEDEGYTALSTLSGSRFNTKLKDTAASISVMTEEFLSDIGAFDVSEALEYGNNLQLDHDDGPDSGVGPAGNPTIELPQRYRVRGMKATVARNGFEWELAADTYNLERIEDARGPNSILFGVGSAGGIINYTTKRARLNRTSTSTHFGVASWDSFRTGLDHNHVLVPKKFAVRLTALWNDTNSYRYNAFNNSRRLHLNTTLQLTEKTQFRTDYEYNDVDQNVPREAALLDFSETWITAGRPTFGLTPTTAAGTWGSTLGGSRLASVNTPFTGGIGGNPRFISNTGQLIEMGDTLPGAPTNGQILSLSLGNQGMPVLQPGWSSFRINTGGPEQDRSNDSWSTSAFLEHRLGEKTFVELAFNHQEYDWESWDPQFSNRIYYDPNSTWPGTLGNNPFARRLFLETYWRIFERSEAFDTFRGTFTTELNFGKLGRHRIGLMGEHRTQDYRGTSLWEVYEGSPFARQTVNGVAELRPEFNANKVIRRNYVIEGEFETYHVIGPRSSGLLDNVTDPVTGRTYSSHWVASDDQHDERTQKAGLVTAQSIFFDGGLVVGTGYRYDKVSTLDRGTERDPDTYEFHASYLEENTKHYSFDGQTRTLGIVAHPTSMFSLIYNRASNVGLPDIRIRILPDARQAPPTEGRGEDYGIGLDLFDGRVYARAVRFETSDENNAVFDVYNTGSNGFKATTNAMLDALLRDGLIDVATYDAHAVPLVTGSTRDVGSTGYEFQVDGQLTKSISLKANFSITESTTENVGEEVVAWWALEKPFYERFAQDIPTTGEGTIASEIAEWETNLAQAKAQEGVGRLGNREYKGNIVGRYTFSTGRLKGAYIGGTYKYQGKALVGIMTAAGYEHTPIFSDPVGEAGLFGGFTVPIGDRNKMKVQLNIFNLLDETDYIVLRRLVAPTDQRVRYLQIRQPRSWRLTASYTF